MWVPGAVSAKVSLLLLIGFMSGVLGAVLTPALTAAIPDLVPARKLAAANSLHHLSSQTATLVGQAAGGLAYASIGAGGLVLFDGLTFLVSAGCARLARVPTPAFHMTLGLTSRARAYLRDVRDGMRWLWSRASLRWLILAFTAVNFLFTPVFVLLPVYVKDILGQGPHWYGFLLAAAGGGAMLGALVAPRLLTGPANLTLALLGIGFCTVALGSSRSAILALVLLATVGLLSAIVNVRVMTTLQAATPTELRGRILSVAVAMAGAAVLAGLGLGGLLGGVARAALATVILACGIGIMGVGALFGSRDDTIPR